MVEQFVEREHMVDPAEGETIIAEGVTFENFLKYFGEQHTEWLGGKVISVVANNTQHQMILGFLYKALSFFVSFRSLGRILLAGVPMHIAADRPAREPDLLILLNEHLSRIQSTYIDGPADIVVEIVSPESNDRDRGKKLREYEAAGVPEYWLFDPQRTEAVIYALGNDGNYHPLPPDADGYLHSSNLPGFRLQASLLCQEELPDDAELFQLVQKTISA